MTVTLGSWDSMHGNRQAQSKQKPKQKWWFCRANRLTPRMYFVHPGSPVAIDCESVQLLDNSGRERCGLDRVSIITADLKLVYDTFVYYPSNVRAEPSAEWRKLGVLKEDILPENGAQPHAEVIANVQAILNAGGIVVGHDVECDKNMLRGVDFSGLEIRDTQHAPDYRVHAKDYYKLHPKLKTLALKFLHRSIQGDEHSSVDDAEATMELYHLRQDQIDTAAAQQKAAAAALEALAAGSDPGTTSISTSSSLDVVTENAVLNPKAPKYKPLSLGKKVALPDLFPRKGYAFNKATSTYIKV